MPVSSQTRYRMFGEFSGAVGAAYGPQSGSESRMSSSILPLKSLAIAASLPLWTYQPNARGHYTGEVEISCGILAGLTFNDKRPRPRSRASHVARELLGLFQHLDETPPLGGRRRAGLHQRDAVADAGDAVLVVRLDLLGRPDDLAVQRVPHTV